MRFNAELFLQNAEKLEMVFTDKQIEMFDKLAGMLTDRNKVLNLTAITDPDGIAVKHFADSISITAAADLKPGTKIIDIGTGAGFPGIPLLICAPEIDLTLLDSTNKKLNYVNDAVNALGLKARVVHGRAEDIAAKHSEREQYDYAVSRAVALLNTLCEYCLPFVKVGGKFIAMKSEKADEEIAAAASAIKTLGGQLDEIKDIGLTDGATRKLVVIKKIAPTPSKYPRPSAQIAKQAL